MIESAQRSPIPLNEAEISRLREKYRDDRLRDYLRHKGFARGPEFSALYEDGKHITRDVLLFRYYEKE